MRAAARRPICINLYRRDHQQRKQRRCAGDGVMTHRFLHSSGRESIRHSGDFYVDGLVEPPVVIEADPLSDDTRGVLLGFKAMKMNALLFPIADDASIMPFCCGQCSVMNS